MSGLADSSGSAQGLIDASSGSEMIDQASPAHNDDNDVRMSDGSKSKDAAAMSDGPPPQQDSVSVGGSILNNSNVNEHGDGANQGSEGAISGEMDGGNNMGGNGQRNSIGGSEMRLNASD